MEKIEHRKIFKALYQPPKNLIQMIDVPVFNFLMVDGHGKPDGVCFQQAAEALYPLAYTLKFMVRELLAIDYHVMPMEVRWDVNRDERRFKWTMMLMQPDFITTSMVQHAKQKVMLKKPTAMLDETRFEAFAEGLIVQQVHCGEYEGMDATLALMLAYANERGYAALNHRTHDIYLNDSRKTRPENLKTIMRVQVMEK